MFTELSAALAVTKHLFELQKRIKDTELAGFLADLQMHLSDVKGRCAQAEEDTRKAEARVRELEGELALKGKLTFKSGVYFMEADEVPFCQVCYERDKKLIHLEGPFRSDGSERYDCKVCKLHFYTVRNPNPTPPQTQHRSGRSNWVTKGIL